MNSNSRQTSQLQHTAEHMEHIVRRLEGACKSGKHLERLLSFFAASERLSHSLPAPECGRRFSFLGGVSTTSSSIQAICRRTRRSPHSKSRSSHFTSSSFSHLRPASRSTWSSLGVDFLVPLFVSRVSHSGEIL